MPLSNYKEIQNLAIKKRIDINGFLKPKSRVHVVGAGRSGRAAVNFLHSLNFPVTLHEKNIDNLPKDFQNALKMHKTTCITGEHKKEHFHDCDVLIPSPGIAISTLIPLLSSITPPLIMSETELAWIYCKEIPVIAITGTSGKTTTTSICSAMLEEAGICAFTGGNIGTALSEFALDYTHDKKQETKVIILELSSFQLQTCNLLRPHVAILLNISENHLDYHADMQEYINAKMNIFAHQEASDFAILGESLKDYPEKFTFKAKTLFFDSKAAQFTKTKLIGSHNQNNAEAAFEACKIFGVTKENAINAMEKFMPMENRLEFIAEINNVAYINDSKCTTVDALKVAITALTETNRPICLLAGGKFKGGDLTSLMPLMKNNVKHIALFGGNKDTFMSAFSKDFPVTWNETLAEAVEQLQSIITKNDTVLLAPATSSFDQYENYEMRGEDFRNIVRALQ